eukprot:g11051.t1
MQNLEVCQVQSLFHRNRIQVMYTADIPFGVTRFDSTQRDSQWRLRIDKEESVANAEKRRHRNPITGQGFAKERQRKQRGREENRVLVNNYGISKQSNFPRHSNIRAVESKMGDNEEVKVGSSVGSLTERSTALRSKTSDKDHTKTSKVNVGGMIPKLPMQNLKINNTKKKLTNEQRNRLKQYRLQQSGRNSKDVAKTSSRSAVASSRNCTSRSVAANNLMPTGRSLSSSICTSTARASSRLSSYRSGNTEVILDRIIRLEKVLEEESEKRRRAEEELQKIRESMHD